MSNKEECPHGTPYRYPCEQCALQSEQEVPAGQVNAAGHAWKKRRMANVPYGHDNGMRVIGFIVLVEESPPTGLIDKALEKIIGATAIPTALSQSSMGGGGEILQQWVCSPMRAMAEAFR